VDERGAARRVEVVVRREYDGVYAIVFFFVMIDIQIELE